MFKKTLRTGVGSSGKHLPNLKSLYVNGEKYRKHVDPHEVDSMGRTCLHRSVLLAVDSDTSLNEAIKAGCDLDASDMYGRRAIHYSAKRGHVNCLKRLIAAGASVNVASKDGMSPLMEATKRSQPEAVKMLVQMGKADVNLCNEINGASALHYAACSSEFDCMDILVKARANVNAQDHHGKTPLMLAVKQSHEKLIKTLLNADIDIDLTDKGGRTALHHAAISNLAQCASMLIEAGASVDIQDLEGDTPFVSSIRNNSPDVLQTLMKAGCDRSSIDDLMGTSLTLAAAMGHSACVETLINNGEDADESGYFGMTPLMLASYESQVDTVATLLRLGADINQKGRIGCSVLRGVLLNVNSNNEVRRHEILAMIIKAGADINIKVKGRGLFVGCSNGNNSPLSFAIAIGYISAVRMLLIGGCEVPLQKVLDWINEKNLCAFFNLAPITKLLTEWTSEPRSLKHLCRATVRRSLGNKKVEERIEELPVARSVKRYLNLEELDYCEVERVPLMVDATSSLLMSLNETPCGLRMADGSIMHLINSQRTGTNL